MKNVAWNETELLQTKVGICCTCIWEPRASVPLASSTAIVHCFVLHVMPNELIARNMCDNDMESQYYSSPTLSLKDVKVKEE